MSWNQRCILFSICADSNVKLWATVFTHKHTYTHKHTHTHTYTQTEAQWIDGTRTRIRTSRQRIDDTRTHVVAFHYVCFSFRSNETLLEQVEFDQNLFRNLKCPQNPPRFCEIPKTIRENLQDRLPLVKIAIHVLTFFRVHWHEFHRHESRIAVATSCHSKKTALQKWQCWPKGTWKIWKTIRTLTNHYHVLGYV